MSHHNILNSLCYLFTQKKGNEMSSSISGMLQLDFVTWVILFGENFIFFFETSPWKCV